MKVVLAHNQYQQPGGEDLVAESEFRLLREHQNVVDVLFADNRELDSFIDKLITAINTPFSYSAYKHCRNKLIRTGAEMLHVHNFFPLFSPSIFYAAESVGVPSVLTLHNFRTICPTSFLVHKGSITERSITNGPFWAVRERVYKDSFPGTLALASMIALHKFIGTWTQHVTGFIVLTEFSRRKFIEAGFPADKIFVKPNFLFDPFGPGYMRSTDGEFALFVGRLSDEKGVITLLDAWSNSRIPLVIAGNGPLRDRIVENSNPMVNFVGFQNRYQVQELMSRARFLVIPSIVYEGFPMVLLEAYANGLPVVASDIGSLSELVSEGQTGRLVPPGSAGRLSEVCSELFESKENLFEMRQKARQTYLQNYTPDSNYNQMMEVYNTLRKAMS